MVIQVHSFSETGNITDAILKCGFDTIGTNVTGDPGQFGSCHGNKYYVCRNNENGKLYYTLYITMHMYMKRLIE